MCGVLNIFKREEVPTQRSSKSGEEEQVLYRV